MDEITEAKATDLLKALLGVNYHLAFKEKENGEGCLDIASFEAGALDFYMDEGTVETGVRRSLNAAEVVLLRDFLNDWLDA